ncbi:unnamed protein product, partial [marine sediment metagenome]
MKEKKFRWRYLFMLFILALIINFPSHAFADIAVSRLIFDLKVPSGQRYTGSFLVTNTGKEPESIKVYLGDWNRKPNGENCFFKAGALPQSLCRWIDFSPTEFDLKPGEVKEVKFTINVPERTKGTHWGIFFVEGKPQQIKIKKGEEKRKGEEKGQIIVKTAIRYGMKIYQTDPTTAVEEGKITNLEV